MGYLLDEQYKEQETNFAKEVFLQGKLKPIFPINFRYEFGTNKLMYFNLETQL